ncbi:PPC domain-containing DNA-binding protein [Fretibacterium sp. OH1220_COT-178]|uniref:PPC domain-containing DNA-binding protein n=1 Tax=Fretibacterium sp. OH1220_COT-178 TaxID=2491047 RepID=UPI000F5F96D3|nr:PPC domain-containing DNA-binding protein [Fretibacterium sp. OH1220_COT-178]RRD63928.1 DNA-binding protein [Fretibacterium sp. OH1220_COT-178]
MERLPFEGREARVRTFILRLRPGTDLMEGIRTFCVERGIRSGAITTLLGSLRWMRYVYPVPDSKALSGLRYCAPIVLDGPVELLSGAGTIGEMREDGEAVVHLHAAFTDPEGRVFGGHVLGGPVAVTVEVAIDALDGVALSRAVDEETDMPVFSIE